MLKAAVILSRAGEVSGSDVAFVSIHGTGTPLGDPIEAGALGQALGSGAGSGSRKQQQGRGGQQAPRPLATMSSKACYGHTEGSAGLTGLLLALQVIMHSDHVHSALHMFAFLV